MWSNTSMCACPSSSLIESRFVELIPFSPLFLVSWDDNPKNDKRIVGFDGKNRGGTIGSQTCFVTWEYGSSVGCCLLLRRRGRELEHPWATFLLSLLFSRQEKEKKRSRPSSAHTTAPIFFVAAVFCCYHCSPIDKKKKLRSRRSSPHTTAIIFFPVAQDEQNSITRSSVFLTYERPSDGRTKKEG